MRSNLLFSRHFGHSCGRGKFIFRNNPSSPLVILYPLLQSAHSITSFKISLFVSVIVSGKFSDFIVVACVGFSVSSQVYPSLSACSLVLGTKRMAIDLL